MDDITNNGYGIGVGLGVNYGFQGFGNGNQNYGNGVIKQQNSYLYISPNNWENIPMFYWYFTLSYNFLFSSSVK